jgi:hypothetical protein
MAVKNAVADENKEAADSFAIRLHETSQAIDRANAINFIDKKIVILRDTIICDMERREKLADQDHMHMALTIIIDTNLQAIRNLQAHRDLLSTAGEQS